MKPYRTLTILLISLILFGCASGYKQINFEHLQYRSQTQHQDYPIETVPDVLMSTGNRKYLARANELGLPDFRC